jgi:hypothetical protein
VVVGGRAKAVRLPRVPSSNGLPAAFPRPARAIRSPVGVCWRVNRTKELSGRTTSVAVVEGNGNRYVTAAKRAQPSDTWGETIGERVASAHAAWKLAELGASRQPRSRVRVDDACVARASGAQEP